MAYTDYAKNLIGREAWWETATRQESSSAFPGYDFIEAYWPLDGNYFDYIGANHLTPVNAPVLDTGKLGNCLDITGSNYLSIADNTIFSVNGSTDFAIAFWVRFDDTTGLKYVLAKSNEYYVYRNGTGLYFEALTDVAYKTRSIGTITTGTWYFVVVWVDSTTDVMGSSLDAGTAATTSIAGQVLVDRTGALNLGAETGSNGFAGSIDEVIFWKGYIPDATAIAYLYNSGAGRALADSASSYESNEIAKHIWIETTREESTLPSFYTGYGKRKPVLLKGDKVSGTVTDYPKLLTITTDTEIAAELSATKLAFTNYAGTLIPHGLYPTSNAAAGTILTRVKTTLVENTDSFLFLHYDDAGTDQEDKAGTVSNGFTLFMPMEEDPSTTAQYDWVTETNVGTSSGGMTSGDLVDAQVGNGLQFDDTDLITIPNQTLGEFTLEGIIGNFGSNGFQVCELLRFDNFGGAGDTIRLASDGGATSYWTLVKGLAYSAGTATTTTPIIVTSNQYVVGTCDSSGNLKIYLNGVNEGTGTKAGTMTAGGTSTIVPSYTFQSERIVDEIRTASVVRAANWVTTAYTDDFDNVNTFELGTEEVGGGGAVNDILTADLGTFTLTGVAAIGGINAAHALGTFTLTGVAATNSITHVSAVGAFDLTGITATNSIAHVVVAGEYVLTGIDASVSAATLTAELGTFTLTGVAVTNSIAGLIAAGAYDLTGIATNLTVAGLVSSDAGAYALTGIAASTAVTNVVVSAAGAYALTGIATANQITSPFVVGEYTFTGIDATVNVAEITTFELTGVNAAFVVRYKLVSERATFSLGGIASNWSALLQVAATVGAFTLAGPATDLNWSQLEAHYSCAVVVAGSYISTVEIDAAYLSTVSVNGVAVNMQDTPYWINEPNDVWLLEFVRASDGVPQISDNPTFDLVNPSRGNAIVGNIEDIAMVCVDAVAGNYLGTADPVDFAADENDDGGLYRDGDYQINIYVSGKLYREIPVRAKVRAFI